MKPRTHCMTDERITAYLLDELTEEEAERFEEHCFTQQEWPAEIDAVEQELIDAYLRKELSRDRRRRFEEKYLITDARKARVLTAQSFMEVLCPAREKTWKEKVAALWQRPLVPQFAGGGHQAAIAMPQIAVAVLILAVVAPLLIFYFTAPKTFTRLDLAMVSSDRADGTQMALVKLPLSTDALELHLKLPEPAPPETTYRVEWQNANGTLGELKINKQDSQSIVVIIPANKLSPGRFTLKLFKTNRGAPEQRVPGSYFFAAEATR